MTSQNSGDNLAEQAAKHAAAPQPLTKREQRRARKAAQKAAKEAAKQAKHAGKVAEKAAKKGVVIAPAAAAAPVTQSQAQVAASETSPLSDLPTTMPAQTAEIPPIEGTATAVQPETAGAFVPATTPDAFDRYSRDNVVPEALEPKRKKRKAGKIAVAIVIVLACLVGAGVAVANIYLNNLNQNLTGDAEEAEKVKEVLTPVSVGDKPFYMMLIGCDDREGVDGARSDTAILARLDPEKNKVTLLSIPRDTAIELEDHGTQKFNAAYTYGGPSGTIAAAKKLCGVDISHYAEVHFEALIDIIDYIGGVDVDVPIAIDDVDAGGKVDAGMQHLDGEHAMIFARSRSYTTGDFQRTTSQRLLIKAAVEKILAMDPTEYPGLLMKISECMNTDFSVQELLGLAQAFTDEPELTMYSAIVPSTTAEMDGVSYVVADTATLAELMKVIDKGGNPAKVKFEDSTVKSSKEAKKEGIETIINYGDENYGAVDSGADEGVYYEEGYYDDGSSYDDGSYDVEASGDEAYDGGEDDSAEEGDDGSYEE